MNAKKYILLTILATLALAGCKTLIPSTGELIPLQFQTKQCERPAWDLWKESGETKFLKEPMPEEIILAYLASQSIEVSEVNAIKNQFPTCAACGCAGDYKFTLKSDAKNAEKLKAAGWTVIEQ